MLIVTQASEIVNLDRIERVFVESDCATKNGDYRVVALGGGGQYATLGWYKNQEQAEAAMREIEYEYMCAGRRVYRMLEEQGG